MFLLFLFQKIYVDAARPNIFFSQARDSWTLRNEPGKKGNFLVALPFTHYLFIDSCLFLLIMFVLGKAAWKRESKYAGGSHRTTASSRRFS